ncbi:DUF2971 domain-containing protein [Mucilaginibacter sp. SP1R1]|uniref:DUF2971 domain-containing protein n=1 Tax=Mucilaginibacter sp. SP1R1 TaxID=2723091 RepID=UPI0016210E80|nr:DUF2971 domain-containing protein [Mucilaginibacter sp. SP1R1]MBB6150006.1 hypothetical protein [Mucilaginibacter sp. SP1R1]
MSDALLYKYRGIQNFKNFVDILMKNRLYASVYKALNDPMEGQYYYNKGELNKHLLRKIRDDKGDLKICSLSRKKDNELMWSHYADGHHGIAIGVEIDREAYDVRPVDYTGLAYLRGNEIEHDSARQILSHKLDVWRYEEEERVFVSGGDFVNVTVREVIAGRVMSNYDFGLIRDLIYKINPAIKLIKAATFMDTTEIL